jgi:DNA invertase Pin-like site-specific DNA recombinase
MQARAAEYKHGCSYSEHARAVSCSYFEQEIASIASTTRFECKRYSYMRVSSDSDRQSTNLQRDALLAAGIDAQHLFEDHASRAKDDRTGLAQAFEFVRPDDVLAVWKLDRLGRSLPHLLTIVTSLKDKPVAFRSLTQGMDTTTASGELLFHVFGALAQYERALIQERVIAGLAAARRRGRIGGQPQAITGEKLDAILASLGDGMSKAAVCRNFGVKRTTLIETLAHVGWEGSRRIADDPQE